MTNLRNQNGISLLEVMVGAAISGIVLLAVASMQQAQQKENKAVTEKLAASDVTRAVTGFLSNSATCSQLFATSNQVSPSTAMPFNSVNVMTTNHVFAIKAIPGTGIVPGGVASPLSPSLKISGLQVAVTSPAQATLTVSFNSAGLVRGLNDLTFPNIPIITTGPVTATTITGCGSSNPVGMKWGLVSISPPGIVKGTGLDSVSQSGTIFTVHLTDPMPDTHYTVLVTSRAYPDLSHGQWIAEVTSGRTLNSFQFNTNNWGSTYPVGGYPDYVNVLVIP